MPVMRIVEKGLNMKSSTLHDGIFFIAGLVVAMCMSGSAVAQEATIGKILSAPTSETGRPARSDFDVPGGPLATTLDVFGNPGGVELHYRLGLRVYSRSVGTGCVSKVRSRRSPSGDNKNNHQTVNR